jgi:bifunctional enzyme CysN/CysC
VNLFWLGKKSMVPKKDYILKLVTNRVVMRLEEVHRVIDASDLKTQEKKQQIDRHDVAECTIKLNRAIAFDLADELAATSRFVVIDDYEIRGGGIIREAMDDRQTSVRDKVLLRNYKWEASLIGPERRAEKYNQRSNLVLITGEEEQERKSLAKALESRLFEDGKVVYFLGIGNVLYGVDADIGRKAENQQEHMRRLAEVANLILDAGVILVVTAAELKQEDLEIIKTTVEPDRIEVVWVGNKITTDVTCDLVLTDPEEDSEKVDRIKVLLQEKGVIFRPW